MNYRATFLSAVTAVAVASACNQSKASTEAEPVPAPKAAATGATVPAGAGQLDTSSLAAPLASYEGLRAMLADDQTSGLATTAEKLAKTASEASAKVPGALKAHVDALANAASDLAKKPASDMDEVRKAFGEVSRHLVAILVAEPSLRSGRHVFECPMAQGYKKWVQTSAKIANPYMGKKMLECGGESEWK